MCVRSKNIMTNYREYYDDSGRVCKKCRKYKPYSEYHKHRQCVNGHNTVCKLCRLPLSKENYKKQTLEYKLWHRAKIRAKEKGIPFNIEISDIIVPEECPIFKTKFEVRNHKTCASIDRVIPKLGYIKGNIQIISNRANMIKADASLEEIKKIYEWLLTQNGNCEVN
jgi:hypothetical protein